MSGVAVLTADWLAVEYMPGIICGLAGLADTVDGVVVLIT